MPHTFCSPCVYLPEALGSSSCRGKGIPHTVAGFEGTTDSMAVAALQTRQSLLLDTVQPEKRQEANETDNTAFNTWMPNLHHFKTLFH